MLEVDDEGEIILDDDNRAVALRKMADIHSAISTMYDQTKKYGRVDTHLARNILKCSGYYLSDLGKVLNIETETAKEIEERHTAIRAANMRVHELEKLLGQQQSPETIQMGLKAMCEHLKRWWKLDGFGYVKSIAFGQWACEVDFSCMLTGDFFLSGSETPVSDKERKRLWLESLTTRGFVLFDDDGDTSVLDCNKSRHVLVELFREHLPSAHVTSFENHSRSGSQFALRGVKVSIRDIAEIMALPVPEAKQDAANV